MANRSPRLPPLQRCPRGMVLAAVALFSIHGAPIVRGKEPLPLATEESINLPKVTVKGTPVCSFGIGVVCTRDPDTRKIKRVFISEVLPGSPADEYGLKEGDEILAVNGRKLAGVEGDIKRGAWLFDQLADRPAGETIEMEVAIRVLKKVKLRALHPSEAMLPR